METTALSTTQEALLQAKDIIAQNIASNEKAKEVINFCKLHGIEYYIKEKTITPDI